MSTPKESLTQLLELAAKGSTGRPALAQKLADILLDWPVTYPESARLPFEALLEKTVRETDHETRAGVAQRFSTSPHASVDLLNELFFEAPADAKDAIIARNASPEEPDEIRDCAIDQTRLVEALRNDRSSIPQTLGEAVGLPSGVTDAALGDPSARALAVLCKGAHLSRATFSAIAILFDRARAAEDSYLRLATFDVVPASAARTMLAYWRTRKATAPIPLDRAAE